ncbi:MAG: zf-HC2 domain-containing protein [Myxococcota bacterium]|nr:zf-HC2 domain-containing protein [Myxococcota bacterium]
MRHARVRRLLPGLLDGTLRPRERDAVREHVRACSGCRRRLRDHEAAELLLRLLPPSLVPIETSPRADVRLWGLARWFVDPLAAWRERFGISAVGLGVALTAYAFGFGFWVGAWVPDGIPNSSLIVLAQAHPDEISDSVSMLPLGWR